MEFIGMLVNDSGRNRIERILAGPLPPDAAVRAAEVFDKSRNRPDGQTAVVLSLEAVTELNRRLREE